LQKLEGEPITEEEKDEKGFLTTEEEESRSHQK
jgi:hypothetical protein